MLKAWASLDPGARPAPGVGASVQSGQAQDPGLEIRDSPTMTRTVRRGGESDEKAVSQRGP